MDLPETVRGPDGRSEPFEPERITRSLFEAAERIGVPDAFLARELTEGVLHFLAADPVGPECASAELAEIVAKVVRELGSPELAAAYQQRDRFAPSPPRPDRQSSFPEWIRPTRSPFAILRAAAVETLERFSLTQVFPPELVSAHAEGLIRLTNLAAPLEFAGVVHLVVPGLVDESLATARQYAGSFVAIDGPEYDLADQSGDPAELAERFLHDAQRAADATGLQIVLNLNCQSPPARSATGTGPLFDRSVVSETSRRQEIAIELADRAREFSFTVWWHVAATSSPSAALPRRILSSREGRSIEFVVDRPGSGVTLGPGLDRNVPATLLIVGIDLARLLEMMGGPPVDPAVFLTKVGHLARFAKTAGHAKQDFLRRHGRPALREGFLLERARLVLVPVNLAIGARATDRPPNEFARDIVKTMRQAAENDRPRKLPVRIDAALEFPGWDAVGEPGMPFRQQVKSASPAHIAAGGGRLMLESIEGAIEIADTIEAIGLAASCGICRLCFATKKSSIQVEQESV